MGEGEAFGTDFEFESLSFLLSFQMEFKRGSLVG
jgi:hypothetical protein